MSREAFEKWFNTLNHVYKNDLEAHKLLSQWAYNGFKAGRKDAQEQAKQEPVANSEPFCYAFINEDTKEKYYLNYPNEGYGWFPLYTHTAPNQAKLIAELVDALNCAHSQLLVVVNDINNDRVSFDGDEFHETLEKCDKALAKAKGIV